MGRKTGKIIRKIPLTRGNGRYIIPISELGSSNLGNGGALRLFFFQKVSPS
jgi:hypothetical protein